MINRTRSSRKDLGRDRPVVDDEYSKESKPGVAASQSAVDMYELAAVGGAVDVNVVAAASNDPPTLKKTGSSGSEIDRQSRIAMNLARLDAAAAMASPYLSKQRGYSWRNQTRSRKDVLRKSRNLLATGSLSDSMGTKGNLGSRRKKYNTWKVACLSACCFVVALAAVLTFSSAWATLHTRDPCYVSLENLKTMAARVDRPRVSVTDPSWKSNAVELPKIVHQQWKTKKIPQGPYTLWHNRFKALFPEPEYTHMVWTDESGRELIAKHFPWFLEAYDTYQFGIQRADAVRYFILYHYGGIYADLDYEPLVNFYDHLPKDRVSLVESPYRYNEKMQNSLMSSPKGDPFWNVTFDLLLREHDRPVLHATGPMFLDKLQATAEEIGEEFYALPCENFQRMPFHLSQKEEISPIASRAHREILGRIYPMKNCGDFHDVANCQYARHHNTASYLANTGVLKLLWT